MPYFISVTKLELTAPKGNLIAKFGNTWAVGRVILHWCTLLLSSINLVQTWLDIGATVKIKIHVTLILKVAHLLNTTVLPITSWIMARLPFSYFHRQEQEGQTGKSCGGKRDCHVRMSLRKPLGIFSCDNCAVQEVDLVISDLLFNLKPW